MMSKVAGAQCVSRWLSAVAVLLVLAAAVPPSLVHAGTLPPPAPRVPAAQKSSPAVASISPNAIRLEPGGSEATVTVTGSGLDAVTAALVVVNGVPVRTVEVRLSPAAPTSRQVMLKATAQAAPGSTYQLRLMAGTTALDVPVNLVRVEVTAPRPAQSSIASLTINPTTVSPGQTATGTVTLSAPAPAGGTPVTLASSHSAATVPPRVTVPAGQTQAKFSIATQTVATPTPVTISAAYAGVTKTAALTVTSPSGATPGTGSIASLTINPTTLPSGQTATGTVTLSAPAPAGGTPVTLASSNAWAAAVPASMMVPAGQTQAAFSIATQSVPAPTPVTISATYAGVTKTGTLTVTPRGPVVTKLEPDNRVLFSPGTMTGTVTLGAPAPASGAVVALSSSSASAIVVPASVTVPAGQTSTTFPITLGSVTDRVNRVEVTAASGGASVVSHLDVWPGWSVEKLELSKSTVLGGTPVTGTVSLFRPAPGSGVTVPLFVEGSSAANTLVTVPPSVAVPAGQASASFTITTTTVTVARQVRISANDPGLTWSPGAVDTWKSKTLQLEPAGVALMSVELITEQGSVGPSVSVVSGRNVAVRVRLVAPAPAGGMAVMLTSNFSGVVTVPPSVTVPAGVDASQPVLLTPQGVATATVVTISGTAGGVTKTAQLEVKPGVMLQTLTVTPQFVKAGTSATGTVTLSVAAPPEGALVTLMSYNVAATVPPSVTVPAGQTNATFSIATLAVQSGVGTVISASYGGVTKNTDFSIQP